MERIETVLPKRHDHSGGDVGISGDMETNVCGDRGTTRATELPESARHRKISVHHRGYRWVWAASTKYFRMGGTLYGLVYAAQRMIPWIISKFNTFVYHTSLAECGRRTVFREAIYVLHPKRIHVGADCFFDSHVRLISEVACGRLEIGDGTQVSYDAVLDFTGNMVIGQRVKISAEAVVYTHDHGHDPRSQPVGRDLSVGDGAWIGFRAIILPGVGRIGKEAIVGAGAVVTRAVPDGAIVGGNPARVIGHRRAPQGQGL